MFTPSLELALILLIVGLAVYMLELFIPSAGTLFIIGTACVVGAIVVAFLVSTTMGSVFLLIVTALAFILPGIGFEIWKRSPIGRRMFLDAPEPTSAEHESSVREVPGGVSAEGARSTINYQALKGQVGKTVTPLRPAGKTEFFGRRFDTVAQGVMIERDQYVKVVEVQGNKIVVRPLTPEEVESIAPDFGQISEELKGWSLENHS